MYRSAWWQVEEHAVINPDNTTGMYNVLHCGDGVTVLAEYPDGGHAVIREYKYAIGRHILQLPSGGVDSGETPLNAAQRELLEETGLTAATWTPLGIVHPYPTNVAATVYLFHATGTRRLQPAEPGIELLRVDRAGLHALVAGNQITHAASLVCVLTHLWQPASTVVEA